jgi:hypothetical protein
MRRWPDSVIYVIIFSIHTNRVPAQAKDAPERSAPVGEHVSDVGNTIQTDRLGTGLAAAATLPDEERIQWYERHLPDIDAALAAAAHPQRKACLYALMYMTSNGRGNAPRLAAEVAGKHIELFLDLPLDRGIDASILFFPLLKGVIQCVPVAAFKLVGHIEPSLTRDPFSDRTQVLIMQLADVRSPARAETNKAVAAFIERFDLPGLDFVRAWLQTGAEDGPISLYTNLRRCMELAAAEKDAPRVLFEEFGIRCFGRYPLSVLVEQYRTRDDHSEPYGVLATARSDHNSAFRGDRGGNEERCEDLSQQLKGAKHRLRVIEAGTKRELVELLIRLHRRYGADPRLEPKDLHKIAFLILRGHGDRDGVTLQSERLEARLRRKDIARPAVQPLVEALFEKYAPLLLDSCSTGDWDGFGEAAGRIFHKVIAPARDTGVNTFKVIPRQEGVIDIDVEYNDKHTKRIFPQRGSH